MISLEKEIKYKTARSGGKGGQHVNKVETMVEGYWDINASLLFSEAEKARIFEKLARRINASGLLMVKSQEDRTQLANKENVLHKINALVNKALIVPKKRKPTKPTKASIEKRKESKNIASEKKQTRKKIRLND